jgi:vacuolar-type H+-ATPase subunit H
MNFKTEILNKVNEKEYEADALIQEFKQKHHDLVTDQNDKTAEMVESIKWRIEDCETRVRTRITAEYVLDLGKQIERGM